MRKYIIASHGYLAKGILSSLELIAGEMNNIYTISAYVEDNDTGDSLKEAVRIIEDNQNSEIIILTDLLGGSVNTELIPLKDIYDSVHIISGVNLVSLLVLLTADENEDIDSLIKRTIEESRQGIQYCNFLEGNYSEDF